ncbi:hypothetical protein NDU88_001828 [Pleurodeles waltl]|uniref:Uncharacterized protein n=1 Tax=Pleurodeles waltl TaxID=8319 RepID=A0AAV7M9A0_PLEWA|nr:hypothetical protein NDU88_001828 [Pleurodeles waltl]
MRLSAPPLVRRSYLIIKYKQLWALDMDRAMYALIRTKQKFCVGSNKAGCLLAHPLRAQTTQRRVKALMAMYPRAMDRKHWGALLCTGVLDLDFKKQRGVSR